MARHDPAPALRSRTAHRLATVTIALATLVSVAVPASAAVATRTSFEGTLEVTHADSDTAAPTYEYRLHTAAGSLEVHFPANAPEGFVTGARVRVTGRRDLAADGAQAVAALDGANGGQLLESAPGWSGPRKVAVILMNFSNDGSKPFSSATANGIVFTNASSARAYFAEQSHGAVILQGRVFDWVRIPYSSTTCDYRAWADAATAAVIARGADLSPYTNFMFMFPHTNACWWGGLGHLPGPNAWINGGPSLRVVAHELGHNLGVHHANSLRCTVNGVPVPFSAKCTTTEYGDPFTTMGGARTRHVHNLELLQIGYLPSAAARAVVSTGSYALIQASATSGTRILGIPRGDGTWFYLEYRRPYGSQFDNFTSTDPVVRGVTIRYGSGWTHIQQTQLIDTRPATTTFLDAPLRLDRTFRDPLTGITVRVDALGTSTARVWITTPPDTIAPTTPGGFVTTATATASVSLAWTAATDNRALAGYRIWRGGALVASPGATTTAYTDSGLAPGTGYDYTLRAVDAAGNLSAPATLHVTTRPIDTPPTAPAALAATVRPTSAELAWSAATDNVGVTGYRVYRDGTLIGSPTGLSLVDTGLFPETTYTWTVRAVDTAGQLGPAATVTRTTPEEDATPPSRPVATIVPENPAWARLCWTAATDNLAVVGYRVYRDGVLVASTDGSTLDLRVQRGATFQVIALDGAGNASLPSDPVSA